VVLINLIERNKEMKNWFYIASLMMSFAAFPSGLPAQDTTQSKISFIGSASIVEGQYINGMYTAEPNGTPDQPLQRESMTYRPWINNEYAKIGAMATLNSHFSVIACPQIRLWNDSWDWTWMGQDGAPDNPFIQHVTVSLADAEGIFRFGNKDVAAFTMAVGVFPFKYNDDAKNLGEYLFRTGEHPAYIQTSFDYPNATLTGIRMNTELAGRFSLDVLFTQETQIIPLNDWSLSVLAGYKVPKLLDIGAGVMFDRLFPVAPNQAEAPVSTVVQNTYYTSNGTLDTLKWGGTKVMARVSFDPKGLLPASITGILGKEDGKIYAEASVLGLKSFSAYKKKITGTDTGFVIDSMMNFYSDIKQRIPVMVGFNVPTFKILDYLSVEVEYFGWPYSPSLYNYESLLYTFPQPIIPNEKTSPQTSVLYTNQDNWKWSINVRKTILGNLSIIGQIARDHTRHDVFYSTFADPEEVFIQPNGWGWWLKFQYSL
jgi:hypothetical protein